MRAITLIRLVIGFVLGVFILSCLGLGFVLEFAFFLAFGWMVYLRDVVAKLTVDPASIATAILALGLLAIGVHWFGSWLVNVPSTENAEGPASRWRQSWTLATVALVATAFCVGISLVGLAHQVVWAARADERWLRSDMRAAMYRSQSKNNLKQLGLALHNYHDAHDVFPPGGTFNGYGEALHSWETHLLPYLDEVDLYNQIHHRVPWDSPANADAFRKPVEVFRNPAGPSRETRDAHGYALSHYSANQWVLGGNRGLSWPDFTDGLSNTILAGEVVAKLCAWGDPLNWRDPMLGINTSPDGFGGPWIGNGSQFLLGDGTVRLLNRDIDPQVLKALSTPNGGEPVGEY